MKAAHPDAAPWFGEVVRTVALCWTDGYATPYNMSFRLDLFNRFNALDQIVLLAAAYPFQPAANVKELRHFSASCLEPRIVSQPMEPGVSSHTSRCSPTRTPPWILSSCAHFFGLQKIGANALIGMRRSFDGSQRSYDEHMEATLSYRSGPKDRDPGRQRPQCP